MNYQRLDLYRIYRRQSISALAREIGVNTHLLRRTLRGETKPHDYNAATIDRWIDEHKDDIEQALEN